MGGPTADGWAIVCYGRGNGNLLQDLCQHATHPRTIALSVPGLKQASVNPHFCQRPLSTHRQVWFSLLRVQCSFLLGPGAPNGLFVPSKSLFPKSCGSSVIKFHWPSKAYSLGVLSPSARTPGCELSCGPHNFHSEKELLLTLLYQNSFGSPVCGLHAQLLYSVQSLSHVQFFANPWTAARQASLSITNSRSLLKLMSTRSVMPSNYLILYCPLLLLPSLFPHNVKSWCIGGRKTDAEKDWRQKEKRQQGLRWLDNIINLMDMNVSKIQEIAKEREDKHAVKSLGLQRVIHVWVTEQQQILAPLFLEAQTVPIVIWEPFHISHLWILSTYPYHWASLYLMACKVVPDSWRIFLSQLEINHFFKVLWFL